MEKNIDVANFLMELIINNTRLNYDKDELRIENDAATIEVIKVLDKSVYEKRFQELIEKENKED